MAWFDEIATPSALIVFLVAVVLTGAARFGFGPPPRIVGVGAGGSLGSVRRRRAAKFFDRVIAGSDFHSCAGGFRAGCVLGPGTLRFVAPAGNDHRRTLRWVGVDDRPGRPTRHDRGRPQFYSGDVDRITDRHRPRWSNVGKCDDSTHPIGDHGHRSKFIGVDRGRAGPCSNQRGNRVGVGRIFRLELAVVPVPPPPPPPPPPARLLLLARPSRWRQQMGRWCWRTGFQAPVSPSWDSFFSVIGRWDLYLWAAAAWPAPYGRCWSSPSPPW